MYKVLSDLQSSVPQGFGRNIDGQLKLLRQARDAVNMVAVLMRNKDRLDVPYGESDALHPFDSLAARETSIDQDGFFLIPNVIAVGIASRIKRTDEHRHIGVKVGNINRGTKTLRH